MKQIPTQELWNNPDFMKFISAHEQENTTQLAFQYHTKINIPLKEALEQILLRKKAQVKLPEWAKSNCLFTELGLEQCSSALAAEWKAKRISDTIKPEVVLDCNTGLGVDSTYFSKSGIEVLSIEKVPELVELCKFNQKQLGLHFRVMEGEVISWLKNNPAEKFDLVYADPDRRNEAGQRISHPDELNPPVSQLLQEIKGRCKNILLKLSPLFDPKEGIRIFPGVKEIWIISIHHECREILYLIEEGYTGEVSFVAAAWFRNRWFSQEGFPSFSKEDTISAKWVYLTDVAFTLSGLAPRLPGILAILDRGSIAISDELLPEYPGVAYQLIHVFTGRGKDLKQSLKSFVPEPFINISAKGTRIKSEELLKQLGKKSGGDKLLLIRPGESGAWLLKRFDGKME